MTPLVSIHGKTGRIKTTFNIHKLRFDAVEEKPATPNVWRDHTEPRGEDQ